MYHGNSDINSLVWAVLWIPTDLWQAINTALGPPPSLYNIHGRNIWWSLTGSSVRISEWGSRCSGPLAQYKPTPPRCPRVRADESRLLLRGKLFSLIVPDVVWGARQVSRVLTACVTISSVRLKPPVELSSPSVGHLTRATTRSRQGLAELDLTCNILYRLELKSIPPLCDSWLTGFFLQKINKKDVRHWDLKWWDFHSQLAGCWRQLKTMDNIIERMNRRGISTSSIQVRPIVRYWGSVTQNILGKGSWVAIQRIVFGNFKVILVQRWQVGLFIICRDKAQIGREGRRDHSAAL